MTSREAPPTTTSLGRLRTSVRSGVPALIAGTVTLALGSTGAVTAVAAEPSTPDDSVDEAPLTAARAAVPAATPAKLSYASVFIASVPTESRIAAPHTYRVKDGDTVSSIAKRYGLSTASVLALNGLGWKTTIYPGQQLRLTKSTAGGQQSGSANHTTRHTVAAGETISSIAAHHGLSTASVLRANGLHSSSIIYPGQRIALPKGQASVSATAASSTKPLSSGTSTAKAATRSYVIRTGDTISAVASRFGVSTESILEANSLGATSLIYAGRTIIVPRALTAATLTPTMRSNARTIIRVGRDLGVSNKGIVIALSAALQESTLRNLNYGHLDSVGLFQQRPSYGWGSRDALRDPAHAARLFYGGPSNPNAGVTRGLLDIPGWQSMSVTRAAQAVQVSAFPTAYAKWEKSARSMLADLG